MLRHTTVLTTVALLTLFGTACTPQGGKGPGTETTGAPRLTDPLPLGLEPEEKIVPADNPLTQAKVDLGWHLYYDTRLSKDGTVACVTCHDPAKGWSDGKPLMVGIRGQVGGRNSPTIMNRVFSSLQFWDGRSPSLEDQALGPIQADKEMGNTLENMVATLEKIGGYKPLFTAAFGDEKVTAERVGQAIASFERTIVSGNSPFDRYQNGDATAMSESAIRGHKLFMDRNKGRCSICHAGFNFTDELYHNIGVGMDQADWETNHAGRFAVTNEEKDKGAYKTPTLRNIADSGPYMHDGSEATLEAIVEFYAKGGSKPDHPNLDKEMKKLDLTDQDKKDLVEFMKALSGDVTQVTAPAQIN